MTHTQVATDAELDARVQRLSNASLRRVIEPENEVSGRLTKVQVLPDELLSVAGLDLTLSPAQRATLAREEVASIARFGVMFESVLMSAFGYRLAFHTDVTDPRFTYALHEIGEETRHSRLFIRLLDELDPSQRDPFAGRIGTQLRSRLLPLLMTRPATLDAFVLAGEEIPDLFQRLAAEHPDTDDHVRAISRYHRLEEARHLAYARLTVGEHYRQSTPTDRLAVRWVVPVAIIVMFDTIVQPYVYETIGLPPLRTWLRVRRQPQRVALRRKTAGVVLSALTDAGIFTPGHIPILWRYAAAVDGTGVDAVGPFAQSRRLFEGPATWVTGVARSAARALCAPASSLSKRAIGRLRSTLTG